MSASCLRVNSRAIKIFFIVVLGLGCSSAFSEVHGAPKDSVTTKVNHDSSLPTTITSDTLTLRTQEKKFIYKGNVVMAQGAMTVTCNTLEGTYTENNEIEDLTALGSVIITKGDELEARGERADFDNERQIVTMTQNPSVLKGKSQLNADLIKVFLETEETIAEGRVQMKIIQEPKEEEKKDN